MEYAAVSLLAHRCAPGRAPEYLLRMISSLRSLLAPLESSRYSVPRQQRASNILPNGRELFDRLPEQQFKEELMLSKLQFTHVFSLIEHHPVFHSTGRKPQTDPFLQLLITLNRIGFQGNATAYSKTGRFSSISVGSLASFTKRVFTAITSLEDEALQCANLSKQAAIQSALERKYGLPNRSGSMDDTPNR
ncbi:hypothetical protein BJ741DRAFT_604794 [Chytriomyces cf. hyalinus JEL632]|nr:hypothetical protein BJ741DRAFT_604794 [Chytriomyces cf. hyalinus JEL632]